MTAATQGFLSLPTELLSLVCSFLVPEDVLCFAQSSKACANGAADILHGLQDIFLEYQTIDDNDPMKLLNKLRSVLRDDFRARCVRRLEFSNIKSNWEGWVSEEDERDEPTEAVGSLLLDDTTANDEVITRIASNHWESYYTSEELEAYRQLLRASIFRNFTANTLTNEHVIMLRHGQDDVLKLLLIAFSPRLESLTFYALRPTDHNKHRLCPHPLYYSFLAHDQQIRQIFDPEVRWFARSSSKQSPWPPGFRSLRKISICAPLPEDQPSSPFYARPANVAGLFWLPNIETLELYQLRHRRDGDQWMDIMIGCSSVKNLRFESCQISTSTMLRFITASRSLRKLDIKRCGRDLGFISGWVGDWYAESLGK